MLSIKLKILVALFLICIMVASWIYIHNNKADNKIHFASGVSSPRQPILLPKLHDPNNGDLIINTPDVFIINMWASWCEVCKKESQVLNNIYNAKYKVVGIGVNDNCTDINNFVNNQNILYKIICDNGTLQQRMFHIIPINVVPVTLVIKEYKVRLIFIRELKNNDIDLINKV